jgi:hypothetical protein
MRKTGSYFTVFAICFLLAAAVLFLEYCKPKDKQTDLLANTENKFVGDQQCQSCHTKEYALWQQSDHYKAMMPANDTTVLGDFNNTVITADGITSRFFKRDGKYIINTEGPDGQLHDYEVLYTFGHTPLQQYLVSPVRGPKNGSPRLAALVFRWTELEHHVRLLSFYQPAEELHARGRQFSYHV